MQASPEEVEAIIEVLYRRETALSWLFQECCKLLKEAVDEIEIAPVHHMPWQCKSFPIARKLEGEVTKMLQDRIDTGRLERSPVQLPKSLVPCVKDEWQIPLDQ